jgi:uncharacterized protein YkvS
MIIAMVFIACKSLEFLLVFPRSGNVIVQDEFKDGLRGFVMDFIRKGYVLV